MMQDIEEPLDQALASHALLEEVKEVIRLCDCIWTLIRQGFSHPSPSAGQLCI